MVVSQPLQNIQAFLKEFDTKEIFLVHGQTSFEKSGAKAIILPLLKTYQVTLFSDFTENPKLEDAVKGAKLFQKNKAKLIIAIGGGSAIDIAKLIKVLVAQQTNDPISIINSSVSNLDLKIPLIAIPTTAGTGSEVTHFAVVYYNNKKYSVAHPKLLPDLAFLDSILTASMPPNVTAHSGLDAFCQAVESYWNVNSTEESRGYAKEAIKLILDNLPVAVNNPNDEVRRNMMEGANLAGKAINITKTTAPHALSYMLTSNYGIAHGHAVALFLPAFLTYNAKVSATDCNDERGATFVKERIVEIEHLLGVTNTKEAYKKLIIFVESLNVLPFLSELRIKKTDLSKIANNINQQRLKNNPRKVDTNNLLDILEDSF